MEPLTTTTAVALATVITTKALEKIGENIGGVICTKTNEFLRLLKKESPNIAQEIEKADEESFDYTKILPEVVSLSKKNQELSQLINELANLSKTHSLSGNFTQNLGKANQAAQTISNIFNAPVTFNWKNTPENQAKKTRREILINKLLPIVSIFIGIYFAVPYLINEINFLIPRDQLNVPNINRMTYHNARKKLLKQGWIPKKNHWSYESDVKVKSGNGPTFWEKGYWELQACSGTGYGYCRFEFSDPNQVGSQRILVIITAGQETGQHSATVYDYFIEEEAIQD